MRQLVHVWQRFSGRERLLAGMAGAILVLAVLRYGVVDPYRAYVQRLQERIEREAERVQPDARAQRQRPPLGALRHRPPPTVHRPGGALHP